jgi:antitoxin (DNA-binding transcriptional repressor) of toxin-antitoxin stability system
MIEEMAILHITEAELARDVRAVLDKIESGAEIVVQRDDRPVAVIKPPAQGPGRTISECIAIARQRERERGYPITLDPDFAADIEETVRNRQPWNPSSWD